jgi:hypothetical protein
MNWGKGIIVGMSIFILFIVAMCVYMIASPHDSFDNQYYEKGLSFDRDYAREEQVTKDHAQPSIVIEGRQIKFLFSKPARGTVKLISPSSSTPDKVYSFTSENGDEAHIVPEHFSSGKWQLVLEWESDNKNYLYQQAIYLK